MRPTFIAPFAAVLAALVLTAGPAVAQPAPADDPIGALLQATPPAAAPEPVRTYTDAIVTPPTATPPPSVGQPYIPTPPPSAPSVTLSVPPPVQPYSPPAYPVPSYLPPSSTIASAPPPVSRPALTAPVHIDEIGRTPDSPPTDRDQTYEARFRSSFASAQGQQGPLDGSWTLRADDVGDLYRLELRDRSGGVIEGAWRDLKRMGAIGASGFLDDVQRYGGQLTLRFYPRGGAEPVTATLAVGDNGRWMGELVERGERRSVTLRRN